MQQTVNYVSNLRQSQSSKRDCVETYMRMTIIKRTFYCFLARVCRSLSAQQTCCSFLWCCVLSGLKSLLRPFNGRFNRALNARRWTRRRAHYLSIKAWLKAQRRLYCRVCIVLPMCFRAKETAFLLLLLLFFFICSLYWLNRCDILQLIRIIFEFHENLLSNIGELICYLTIILRES